MGDVTPLPMLFPGPVEALHTAWLRVLLTATSMKERSQTVGTEMMGKRLIERGTMRTREAPNNGEELLTVPGM